MEIKRHGSAVWQGDTTTGKGALSTESGALAAYPYGFSSRFDGQRGSNPEELLAAAHAGCFTMALSLMLGQAGFVADRMGTGAIVTLAQVDGGYAITRVELSIDASVPRLDAATFDELAHAAKAGCPVSKLFNTEISLRANLASSKGEGRS